LNSLNRRMRIRKYSGVGEGEQVTAPRIPIRDAMFPDLISVVRSDKLREGHNVPTRIFDANFPCIMESFSHGSDDLSTFDGANDLVQVLDFHVEEDRDLTSFHSGRR